MQRVGIDRVMAGEGFAKGVDRRGADVAEHDADRADHQFGERALGLVSVLGFGSAVRILRRPWR